MTQPLADLRIIAVEQYGTGPHGSSRLAHLGAEVISIEDPTSGEFEALVRTSDAVFSNVRRDVRRQLRIRYDDLRHLNPRIVCCSLRGFGTDVSGLAAALALVAGIHAARRDGVGMDCDVKLAGA